MMLIKAIILILLGFSSTLYAESDIVTTTRIETDSVVENELESQLEDRLSRDMKAYLDHSRFVISVDYDVITTRTDTLVPINKKNTKRFPSKNTVTTTETKTLESESGIATPVSLSDAEFALPGLPLSSNSSVNDIENVTPINETTTVVVEEETNSSESIEEESYVALSPHIVNRIEKMSIHLVLDEDTIKSDQRFLENLILDKSQFSRIRGDEFELVLTGFAHAEVESVEQSKPGLLELGIWDDKWFWLVVVLAITSFLLLILLLRRNKTQISKSSTAQTSIVPPTTQGFSTSQNQSDQDTERVMESFVSAALTSPELVRNYFKDRLDEEAAKRTLAALNETIPSNMFNSLFPSLPQNIRRELNDRKVTELLPQTQKNQIISDLVRDIELQQGELNSNASHSKHKPFSFLAKLNTNQIIYVLNEEPAKIQALVISQLENDKAAEVFAKLPKDLSKDIIVSFGDISEFPLDSFRYVAERLARKAIDAPSFENIHADGIDILSNVLDEMSEMEAKASLESLKNDSPDLYIRIKDIYLTFDEITRVPDLKLGDLMTQFDKRHLAHLVLGAAETTSAYLLNAMTNKMRISVKEEMSQLKGKLDQDIEKEARIGLIKKVRSGIKSGQIILKEKE